MQVSTVREAHAHADRAFSEGRFEPALAAYLGALFSEPEHLDLRLRIADCLLALGHVQRAAVVYTTLARHAAHLGHPLRALVAIKILSTLEPALLPLVRAVADLYAIDGGRIGRGARPVPPPEDVPLLPESTQLFALTGEELYRAAEEVGKDVSRAGARYPEVLPPIPLLSELTKEDFAAVFETVSLVRKRGGDSVLVQGEPGSSFFLAARGSFEVVRDDPKGGKTQLATLHEGSMFGEMALLSRSPRTAHVIATSDADLLELHVEALGRASHGAAAIARALDKFTRERLVSNLMNTAPLFKPLDRTQSIDLVRRFVAHEVAQHTDVIREGEPGRGLFVILHGSADVWKRDGNEKVLLATLNAGDVFGEMSLLNDAPAVATVTTAQRSTVLFLAREYVERLMASVPQLRAYLEGLGDERAMDLRLWLDSSAATPAFADEDIEITFEP